MLAYQSGHNTKTHSLYAPDTRLPGGIDFHEFFHTMRVSGAWHELLGFSPTLLRDLSLGDVTGGFYLQHDGGSNQPQDRLFPSANAFAETVKNVLLPEIVRIQSQTRANDLASLLDAVGHDFRSPASRPLVQPVTHILHPSRLRDVRRFLQNEHATFKHAQQAVATELIASKNPSLLLIGPTGTSMYQYFKLKAMD